jgi:hypothetical protein
MLLDAINKQGTHDPAQLFDVAGFLADSGFRSDTRVHWANHHFSHALCASSSPIGPTACSTRRTAAATT